MWSYPVRKRGHDKERDVEVDENRDEEEGGGEVDRGQRRPKESEHTVQCPICFPSHAVIMCLLLCG